MNNMSPALLSLFFLQLTLTAILTEFVSWQLVPMSANTGKNMQETMM